MLQSGKTPEPPDAARLLEAIRGLVGGRTRRDWPNQWNPLLRQPPPACSNWRAKLRRPARPLFRARRRRRTETAETAKAAEAKPSGARSIKVETAKLDYLVDMVGEMVISQSLVRHDPDLATGLKPRLARNLSQLARITDDVQRTAMSMRMIPVGQLFQKTARLVRDLSRKAGKQVELELAGEETELDRNIVEELADPLMHMVRNSVDHGIESPEDAGGGGQAGAGARDAQGRASGRTHRDPGIGRRPGPGAREDSRQGAGEGSHRGRRAN